MADQNQTLAGIDADEAVGLLQQAIAIDTASRGEGEVRFAQFLAGLLEGRGIPVDILQATPGRPNLVARIAGARPGPRLVLNGHLDTVPFGAARWEHHPLSGKIVGERLYGRGSSDMKGGLLALLIAFLRQAARPAALWSGELVLAATHSEEIGSLGAMEMIRERQLPAFDAMIIAEPTGNRAVIAHKGVLWLRITSFGRSAHGSMPKEGINAIDKLFAFQERLRGIRLRASHSSLLSDPTLAITTISGGIGSNSIPDQCQMTVDIRTLPEQDHADLVAEIESIAASVSAGDAEGRFQIETILDLPGMHTEAEARIVRDCMAVLAERGQQELAGAHYFTDAAVFQQIGRDIVILGPGDAAQAHQTDEHVRIPAYLDAIDIYSAVIDRYLGAERCPQAPGAVQGS